MEDSIEVESANFKQNNLNARIKALPQELGTAKKCPKCHKMVRVRIRNKERTIQTRAGKLTIQRNYHYCDTCKGGFFPRDLELGLPPEGDLSYGLESRMADFAMNDPFSRASERWSLHYPHSASDNLFRRVIDRIGKRCTDSDDRYLQHALLAPTSVPSASYIIVETDGSMIPTRSKEEPWKEVKLAMVYRSNHYAAKNDDTEKQRGFISESRFTAVLGGQDEFRTRLDKMLMVENKSRRQVVWLGDGALGNWCLAQELSPNAIQILDWYHAVEHAFACGAHVFGQDSWSFDLWKKNCEHLLWTGQVTTLIKELHDCEQYVSQDALTAILELIRYYKNNQHRMRYDQYRSQGYPIGSGAIESAHKHVIQERMKRAGQRWSYARGKQMARLRAAYRTSGPIRFHYAIRLAYETTKAAPIPASKKRRASNR